MIRRITVIILIYTNLVIILLWGVVDAVKAMVRLNECWNDDGFCDYDVLDEFCDDLDDDFCDDFWSLITIDQVLCVISLLALVVVHTALKGGGKTMFFLLLLRSLLFL